MATQIPGAGAQTATGGATSAAPAGDATQLLMKDHKAVLALFDDFDAATADADKGALAKKICMELKIHSKIEEELFYPAARDALNTQQDKLVDEALDEHAQAAKLIGEIEAMDVGEAGYDHKVKHLATEIKHHIDEEQNELFPAVRKTSLDLNALGAKLAARKAELMAKNTQSGGKALS
jgi:hemerythrin-like domain-containing protein